MALKRAKLHCILCNKKTNHYLKLRSHGRKSALFYKCGKCKNLIHHANIEEKPLEKSISRFKNKETIILTILLLLLFICGCHKKEEIQNYNLTFKVIALNHINIPITANYTLYYINLETKANRIINHGELEPVWNVINIKNAETGRYFLFYGNENYYLQSMIYDINFSYTKSNVERNNELLFKKTLKKSNITITHNGTIGDILNITINSDDRLNKMAICLYKTIGIVRVFPQDFTISCQYGIWLNYTNSSTVKGKTSYQWLPEGYYKCGDYKNYDIENDIIIKCSETVGNLCKINNMNIPKRLTDKVDECYNLGYTLVNENLTLSFSFYNMPDIDESDYIDFYILDQERSPINKWSTGEWLYSFGEEEDLGIQDYIYKIYYKNI